MPRSGAGIPRPNLDEKEYAKSVQSIQMVLNRRINKLEEKLSSLTKKIENLELRLSKAEL